MRAERAIPVAARLAHTSGGSVILVRVVSKSSGLWPSAAPQIILAQQVIAADRAEAEQYLSAVSTSLELEGVPTEAWSDLAQRSPPCLLWQIPPRLI